MASSEDPVHPLRISKGSSTPGSPPPTKASTGIPRPLSELSPSDLRRNSPSFKQPSKKMTLNTDSSPFQSSPLETTTSPRLFWQKRNLDSISTENSGLYGGARHGSPSPTRRTSIERLQRASRVKNSNILALEQKQEYDPTRVPQIERPLAKHSGPSYDGTTTIINGLRSSDSLNRGIGHQRNNSSRSSIPIFSPTTSPTKGSTPMQINPANPPRSPGKDQGSPIKSSLSRSNFKSSFDPETGTWSADTSFDDRELPSGKSLHRHAKSVTFDAAPPQINEYEMATPDISSIGSNSREGSFDSMDDEDDEDGHYHFGDHDMEGDSFDASLEDTDKTPVVGPDDWRQSAERMEDPFDGSPMPDALPPRIGRTEHTRSDSSTSDHRPLPPLPGLGSPARGSPAFSDSRSSPGLSATAERMVGAHRSLPPPPPAAASKNEIQSIGNGKMTLEERLKLMMLSDDHKSANEQQRERRLRRGAQRDRIQSPASDTETAESSMLSADADEADDTIGDISALEDYELPSRISRESIMRRVNGGVNDQGGDYFSSPAPSSSPERPSPERRLPLPLDPDVPIPSTEDSILDDISELSDEGSVIIHRDEASDVDTESITDFYARSDIDENDADSASHYSDGPARQPEVTQVDEDILTPRAASPFQTFDLASEIRPLELKSDKGFSSPEQRAVSPADLPVRELTPETKVEEDIEPTSEPQDEVVEQPQPEPEVEKEPSPEMTVDAPVDTASERKHSLPEFHDEGRDNEFSKGLQSFMLPPPPEPSAEEVEELQPPPKMTELQAEMQRPVTPKHLSKPDYDGSGWGDPEDEEYEEEPGTPESVIHRPMSDSESEIFDELPMESPAIPERQATIKASGSKLKTRPSNTPSDIIAMREARRQVSREVPDIPAIPERHRNRLSRDLQGEPTIHDDEEFVDRRSSFKKRSLTLDLDFGLSLDQDFDRVIEQQKVAFSQLVPKSRIASGSTSRQVSKPTATTNKIISPDRKESQNANQKNQRGYLMRQNTKVVTASDKESSDMWKTRSAGNSPVKTDRPQSWTVEPWNGRPRQKSIRRRANTSGPVPPMPGQESNAQTLNPLAEEDLNPELATEESGERGRLFVKVLGVKDLDLPIPRTERTWFSLTLDNGVHCVTTAWLELARNAPVGQEFELVVPNDLEFQLTLNVKLEKPAPAKKVIVQSPTKASKPKTSTFSRVFASPKKRKEMELRQREEEERVAAEQQKAAQARQMKVAPTAWDLLSPLAAEDGSFARSYVCLKEHESRCYGRPYVVDVACFNEWATEEATFASSVKSKRGNTAVVRRAPYKIGKLELQLLFVPRPKGSTEEDMPKSMNSCIRELKAAEERLAKNWEGHLSQQGGDCPYWRRRYFKLVGQKLTAYHEATRQPRATINLANAKRLIDDRRALTERETTGKGGRRRRSAFAEEEEGYMFVEEGFRIRFNNGETIDFYADTAEDKQGWLLALTDLIGTGRGDSEDDVGGSRKQGKWCELILKREEALRRRQEGRRVHSRHVFGKPTRKEFCYDNLHISRNAWDTNLVKANPDYLSVNWDAGGGGAFAVIPLGEKGKVPDQIPLFRGHTATVLDTDWNPFNDRVIASGSEDGKVFLWQVPENFTLYTDADEPADVSPVSKLAGHSRKVGQVQFNPAAENILASASGDFTIKLWDITTGSPTHTLKHNDIVQSLSWNASGSMLVTTSRDKKIRVWDVRAEKPVHEAPGHPGAKNSRAVWMGEHNRFATAGFSRMSERQLALWEPGRSEPIGGFSMLDSISGVIMPFWDDGSNCLYLAGKGDGNIRYYEYENDKFEYLSEYKSAEPQRGIAFVPRRGINVHENEVMRAYKTVNDSYIEPISFTVPRRAETFQSDIFPPATGLKPAVSAKDWLDGKTGIPSKIDLESVYEGTAPKEVASDYKPPVIASAPPPAAKPAPKPAPAPEPTPVARSPPPSMKEQQASMSNMANKFKDDEPAEPEDEDDDSSFEEVQRPAQRAAAPAAAPAPVRAEPAKIPSPIKATSPAQVKSPPAQQSPVKPASANSPASSTHIESSLDQIRQMLEQQTKLIGKQNDKISKLSDEVEGLKRKVNAGGSQDQSERIRQLELELEAARS
ncbi:PH domain-containing protein [Colletotrichum melonis]|uniref:PH domain-containing protein n=1 Tax=Colletotrichum melonis TaxID=1209925 RepID=A0AAI9XTG0_9PEZI|nr:PH domain-containing protein [Colletotrichum melonis]